MSRRIPTSDFKLQLAAGQLFPKIPGTKESPYFPDVPTKFEKEKIAPGVPIFKSTQEAFAYGEKIRRNEKAINQLKDLRQKQITLTEELRAKADFNGALREATNAQFYREAIEKAEEDHQEM